MASVVKRGRRYSIRFRFEGRQYRVTVESRAKAESVKLVIENTLCDLHLQRLSIPLDVDPAEFIASGGRAIPHLPKIGFTEAVDRWLEKRNVAITTAKAERTHTNYLRSFFKRSDLARLDIQAYVDHRLRHVSSETVKKELITLRSILKEMKREGYAVSSIETDRIRLPSRAPKSRFTSLANASDGRRVLLSSEDVRELRRTVRERGSELIADVTDFTALTAARRSEICRLEAKDVDLERGTVTITELKRCHGHITHRVLAIHDELKPILVRRIRQQQCVFTRSTNTLSSGFKDAIRGTKFDVRGFGFHVLRHSAASRLLAEKVAVTAVSNILGHATTGTTLAIYSHAFDEDCEQAIRLL